MIHIAVVEDEEKELELLSQYIRQFAKENQLEIKITTFVDGMGIINPYHGGYDIILLDIQMQYVDGLTAAQKIRENDEDVIIIFITNLAQYAIKGYSVGAMNFVLKPVKYFAFSEELKNALVKLSKKKRDHVMLHTDDRIVKVNIADIAFAETVDRALMVHTKHGNYRITGNLTDLEKELNDTRFFRCHRAYLINLFSIEWIKDNDILVGDTRIPLSRLKRNEFEHALIHLMGETL